MRKKIYEILFLFIAILYATSYVFIGNTEDKWTTAFFELRANIIASIVFGTLIIGFLEQKAAKDQRIKALKIAEYDWNTLEEAKHGVSGIWDLTLRESGCTKRPENMAWMDFLKIQWGCTIPHKDLRFKDRCNWEKVEPICKQTISQLRATFTNSYLNNVELSHHLKTLVDERTGDVFSVKYEKLTESSQKILESFIKKSGAKEGEIIKTFGASTYYWLSYKERIAVWTIGHESFKFLCAYATEFKNLPSLNAYNIHWLELRLVSEVLDGKTTAKYAIEAWLKEWPKPERGTDIGYV